MAETVEQGIRDFGGDKNLQKRREMLRDAIQNAIRRNGGGIRQQFIYKLLPFKVENTGFEPVTSCLPGKRSSQMS